MSSGILGTGTGGTQYNWCSLRRLKRCESGRYYRRDCQLRRGNLQLRRSFFTPNARRDSTSWPGGVIVNWALRFWDEAWRLGTARLRRSQPLHRAERPLSHGARCEVNSVCSRLDLNLEPPMRRYSDVHVHGQVRLREQVVSSRSSLRPTR